MAQNYYQQRREAFQSFMTKNIENALNFEAELNDQISKIWNEKIYDVMVSEYKAARKESRPFNWNNIQSRFWVPDSVKSRLQWAAQQGNPQTFLSGLGQAFEHWLSDEAITPFLERGNTIIDNCVDGLLESFVSGAKKSTSSVVKGIKNIRADIVMSKYKEQEFQQDLQGVLKGPDGIPLELQETLTVDWKDGLTNIVDEISLAKFLQEAPINTFGFSAKSWGIQTNNKPFMESSTLQKMLNATFTQTDEKHRRHSWEPDYTMEYVVYILSKYLVHIISPVTVALISRTGLTWMNEFLEAHMFYMRVQMDNYWKKHSGGLGRIYPSIKDANVYVRSAHIAEQQNISFKEHKTKQAGHYIDLRLTK